MEKLARLARRFTLALVIVGSLLLLPAAAPLGNPSTTNWSTAQGTLAADSCLSGDACGGTSISPPPPSGHFDLKPVGSWSSLPSDAECADQVHPSTWEPRPENSQENNTKPAPGA